MTDRRAYQQKVQAHLDEWKAELDQLRAKTKGMEADARIEVDRQFKELQQRFDTVNERFAALAKAGGDGYERVRGTVDAAFTEFTNALAALKQRVVEREPAIR